MKRLLVPVLALVGTAGLAATAAPAAAQSQSLLAELTDQFWLAEHPQELISDLLEVSPSFGDLYEALRAGPRFPLPDTGLIELSRGGTDGATYRYTILVPPGYDPARRYPVHMFLHGGVARPAWGPGGRWWGNYDRMRDSNRIAVFPAGWSQAKWWHRGQAENLPAILDEVRRRYNVDENRSYLIGISDGGTGVWFHAFTAATPWAAFLAYIGHPAVLNNPAAATDGQLFLTNLSNKPFFVVSGDRDRLYPSVSLAPYIERFRQAGASIVYRPQRNGGHDMSWVPEEQDNISRFLAENVRDPLPDSLSWESGESLRYNRFHWLLIDELGATEEDSEFPDVEAFNIRGASGRVDLVRQGNTINVASRGVRRFTLLLSPEEFDLSQPVVIVANGREKFRGMVDSSRETMLRWASVDRDRTMLFAAELGVTIGIDRSSSPHD